MFVWNSQRKRWHGLKDTSKCLMDWVKKKGRERVRLGALGSGGEQVIQPERHE